MSEEKMMVSETEIDTIQQFLTFQLGTEVFALPVPVIREVIEFGRLTEIPMMPGFLRGVINLRGSVIPVIDLSLRFGRGVTQETKRTCIVIVDMGQSLILGVMVDVVHAVLDVDAKNIEGKPSFGAQIRTDFIHGMMNIKGNFVIVLEVEKVLSVEEIGFLLEAHSRTDLTS